MNETNHFASCVAALLLGSALACARTPPAELPAREPPPPTFVERETAEPARPSGAAPVEGLSYWARPTLSADEFLAQAEAAGLDAPRRVEVRTTAELIAALAPNTAILLHPGRYVFDDSNLLGDERERAALPDYAGLSPHYDGAAIHDVHDLALVGLGPEPAVIVQPDSYAPALSLRGVADLAIYNLAIGHRPEQGWCMGGVIRVIEGQNLLIAGATLFGSGTEGLSLVGVDGLTLRDSVITDCSEQFSTISNSRDVVYERVEIAGNYAELLRGFAIYRSTVRLVDSNIHDNHALSWSGAGDSSYGLLFAIDGDYDWGEWFVERPRAVEPGRTRSEVVLRDTLVEGERLDREL